MEPRALCYQCLSGLVARPHCRAATYDRLGAFRDICALTATRKKRHYLRLRDVAELAVGRLLQCSGHPCNCERIGLFLPCTKRVIHASFGQNVSRPFMREQLPTTRATA